MSSILSKIVFLGLFIFSSTSNAWTINANFEGGALNTSARATNAFSEAFTYTKYSNDFLNPDGGSRSAKVSIDAGTSGWGKWGGSFMFPARVPEGGEIWFRAYIYFPANFDFTNNGIGLKTMRLHVSGPNGGEGHYDALTAGAAGLTVWSEVGNNYFGANNPRSKWNAIGAPVPTGKWHAIEMYIKLSATPGNGIYRVWQDGTLVFEDTQTITAHTTSSYADWVYFFTYWNGDAPRSQSAYIDDVIITTDTPSKVDANGNRFIGSKYISPKSPVSSIQ